MRSNPDPACRGLVFTIFAVALTPAFSQNAPLLPAWLESYPGATPVVHSSNILVSSTYSVAAPPADIIEHYRKMFEAEGLPFHPNLNGAGTSIRAVARECDLLIQIRSHPEGTLVEVNCAAKTQSSSQALAPARPGATGFPQTATTPPQISSDWMARHQQKVAEMGIHREHQDAPAPPLVWPSWLVSVRGPALRPESGVDQSKDAMLKARYTTNAPMTEIYDFYRDLLNSHEYPTRSRLSTGQTITGVQQNALGYVEGSNYPDGAPGAYSVIRVDFDRSVLNGPITVTMRFTTHEYIAKRGY
jgi:hypothetical protein